MANSRPNRTAAAAGHPLSASVVAKCAGVDPNRRAKWARRRPPLVRSGPLFTAHDAVETAILAALADANQKIAPDAWLAVRQDVRKLAMAGAEDLWVLVSATGFSHAVAMGPTTAAEIAASVGEVFHVVSVAGRVAAARERFEAEVAKLRRSSAGTAGARQGNRS